MKYLFPKVTILMTVHMKSETLEEAILSVLGQTRQDFQFVIVDSGAWHGSNTPRAEKMRDIYNRYSGNEKIEWVFTGENYEMSKTVCMIGKVTNEAFKAQLVRGEFVSTFYDDDVYRPDFIEKMAGFLEAEAHKEYDAVRCSQARTAIHPDGHSESTGMLVADNDIQKDENMDCRVDGMQVMMRLSTINKMLYPYLPEDIENCSHSDGVFFNSFGAVMNKMGFINEVLCEHRHTPDSTYSPTEEKKRLI